MLVEMLEKIIATAFWKEILLSRGCGTVLLEKKSLKPCHSIK